VLVGMVFMIFPFLVWRSARLNHCPATGSDRDCQDGSTVLDVATRASSDQVLSKSVPCRVYRFGFCALPLSVESAKFPAGVALPDMLASVFPLAYVADFAVISQC